MRIAVLGAGAWGTAIAISLARRHEVVLWARSSQQCSTMRAQRTNERIYRHSFRSADDQRRFPCRAAWRATFADNRDDGSAARDVQRHQGGGVARRGHLAVQRLRTRPRATCTRGVCRGAWRLERLRCPVGTQLRAGSRTGTAHRGDACIVFCRIRQGSSRGAPQPAFRVYSSDDLSSRSCWRVKNVMAIAAGISMACAMQ